MGYCAGNGNEQGQLLSKIATGGGHGENSSYFDGWKAYMNNPFHPTENREGVIQMGLAENQLCHDLIQDWIRRNPDSSVCTPEGAPDFQHIANFQDYNGLEPFRRAMAKFMEKVRGGRVAFDPDRIVMSGGATGAQETIAFCLADPGDAFLIPTPYYPGFDRDFRWRTGVQLHPVHCQSSNGFKVTAAALESAFDMAQKANIRVKGVLLTNPSNPLGTSMDRATLETIVAFVNAKRIHLVCDEIFAGTGFGADPEFVGVSEIVENDPGCDRNLIHLVYSLSKVLGLPGFRVGVIYSYNDDVVAIARKMSSFGLVSTQTQHFLASLLSDDDFTTKFLAENAKRLGERHQMFIDGLAQEGINCLKGNAGLFCWMDLSWLLKEPTAEEELALWRVIVHEVKLNVSPGTSFHCSEPGWFRVCFANIDHETMEVALRRISSFVGRKVRVSAAKKKNWQGLRLRLSMNRRFEDMTILGSPHLMSPHSPLVHASG